MSAPECPAVSWYEGLPCGLPEGHTDYHEAKGGGVVWGTRPSAREGRPVMTDHTTLTDAEREWLTQPLPTGTSTRELAAPQAAALVERAERIVAARVAEARADERERIAQAIEADACGCDLNRDPFDPASSEAEATCDRVMVEAARIAREGADR